MGNYLSENSFSDYLGNRYKVLVGNSEVSVSEMIERAEAVINGFASVRYETPLVRTPLLEEWTAALVEYELYKRLPASRIPEKIRESYTRTIGQLSDLAANKIGTGGALIPLQKNAGQSPVAVRCDRVNRMTDGA